MKKTLFAIALAAALPLSANAAERSYTYLEGTYGSLDGDLDGFGVRGSVAFGPSGAYGFGSYQQFDDGGPDVSLGELGVGYALELSDAIDLIGEAAYVDYFDIENGLRASVGVRGNFTESFEYLAKANYRDIQNFGDDFTATAGLHYRFSPIWGVTGEVEFDGEDGEIYTVGLRASF